MYIAICEDGAKERGQLVGLLESYAEAHGLIIRLSQFENAEKMLEEARTERFTHYFLDIMMPGMDGMTAAQEIRSFDQDAKIVFLTSFEEYAFRSYRVRASDYLLKPADRTQIFELMDRFSAEEKESGDSLCIQNGRSIICVPFEKLSHLEVYQKKLYFHLVNGQLREAYGALAEYERELLRQPEFIKIHRSYIVNLRQVSVLSPEGCIMFSGKNLPVSRLLYKQVRQAYMEHLFGRGEE